MCSIKHYKVIAYLPILIIFSFILCASQNIYGQNKPPLWGDLPAGKYEIGFKTFDEKDFSRVFYKKSGENFVTAAREIKISLWYPAQRSDSSATKMKFSDYVSAINIIGKSVSLEQIKNLPLAQELPDESAADLLRTTTAAVFNAPFFKGEKFPVIVLGQGLYYESPTTHTILCEFLAGHGFIVATTDLKGAHSPFVKLDAVDLETAVRDLEFVAAHARKLDIADAKKLAIVGFDMGGLAGLILSMRNPEVGAYASLDSGILAAHNLRLVKAMPDYDALRLRAPLFQATHPVEELARFNVSEDASFIDVARFSDRLILRFPDTRHADFTSIPMIESVIAKMPDERTSHRRRSFETIAQVLLAFLKTHLQSDAKSREMLYGKSGGEFASAVKFTKERKTAASKSVSEDEFLNRLFWEGAEKAAVIFRRQREQFPNELIFREETLNQIGYNRLYRGEAAEAIRIFLLNAEAYPKSANAYDSLADAYRINGDKEKAIFNYKKSLELDPGNENAKERLKELEKNVRNPNK